MPNHARLFRRGATYYHRAAIPLDIKASYPKSEETFSLGTKNYDEALKLLRVAAVRVDKLFEAHRRMLRGEGQAEQMKEGVPASKPAEVKAKPHTPLLSEVREEWFATKEREGAWIKRTKNQYRIWTDRFISVVGDRQITSYSKTDGRKFKGIIFKLPANIDKRKGLRGLSLTKVVEVAEELGIPPMSITNANKAISAVSSMWRWIGDNYDEEPTNPLRGMITKTKTIARNERDPFTVQELRTMFTAPTFTGCHSYKGWSKPGTYSLKDSYRYWVPLISLFTGMRLNEVCQLYAEDVKEENGIHYFEIHERREDMHLKTPHSERIIPVHPELIKLGILKLAEEHRAAEARLFPDLKMSSEGYYSKNASMHFQRFFKDVGVKHGKNCFHSFRHCFEDACRNSGVSKELTDALQGHKEIGMAAQYGHGFAIPTLAEAVGKIRYNGLELSHLII